MGAVIMTKSKKNKEMNAIVNEERSMIEKTIERIIKENEEHAELVNSFEDTTIPVMMRLERYDTALLDHLAWKWRTTRSNLAKELLTEMIHFVMRKYYKDKSDDEYRDVQNEIYDEFNEKMTKNKKQKRK